MWCAEGGREKKRKEKGKDETMKAGKVLGKRRKTKTKQNRKKNHKNVC